MQILVQPGRDFEHVRVQVTDGAGQTQLDREFETLQTVVFNVNIGEPFQEVQTEMNRQNAKWGEQNHPLARREFLGSYLQNADDQKTDNDYWVGQNRLTWADILLEEVWEALSAPNTDSQIEELNQVAAVALQAIAALKRKRGNR